MSGDFDYTDEVYYADTAEAETYTMLRVLHLSNGARALEIRDPNGGYNSGRWGIADVADDETIEALAQAAADTIRSLATYYKPGGQYDSDNDPTPPEGL